MSKRPRALQACDVCRTRKNRCNEDRPCIYCVEHDLECTYSRGNTDKRAKTSEHARNQPRNANIGHARASRTPAFRAEDTRFDDTIVQQNGASHHATPESSIIVEDSAESNATSVTRASAPKNSSVEVVDTNVHTNNSEFYGPASLAAFLRNVQTISHDHNAPKDQSLASLLHNTEFNPGASYTSPLSPPISDTVRDRFHFRMAKQYLDAYFSNIHKIQPVFDEDIFLSRCEDLWFDKDAKAPLTFIALYYATMSLGCLVMTPDQSGAHENRFKWSRKLFDDAVAIVARLGTTTDMEMVQCFYMLGKVCQHELNPHVAYLYAGQAARISLAIGLHRAGASRDSAQSSKSLSASQTWWAVYCLDAQTSFALGRPDSLGADGFHNQPLPSAFLKQPMSETHVLHIVPQMVSLSRIMRKVAHELFVQPRETHERLLRAQDLDNELQNWLMHVPPNLSWEKDGTPRESDLKARRHRLHLHKQAVVLRLRYLNLRMVLQAASINEFDTVTNSHINVLRQHRRHCIEAAEATIDLIFEVFSTQDYFQTWGYNATYVLFAVSTLLAAIFRQMSTTRAGYESTLAHIQKAVEILLAIDDCIVTKNAIVIIKRTLQRAQSVSQPALTPRPVPASRPANTSSEVADPNMLQDFSFMEMGINDGNGTGLDDLEWMNDYSIDATQQAAFWTEWAQKLDTLN